MDSDPILKFDFQINKTHKTLNQVTEFLNCKHIPLIYSNSTKLNSSLLNTIKFMKYFFNDLILNLLYFSMYEKYTTENVAAQYRV